LLLIAAVLHPTSLSTPVPPRTSVSDEPSAGSAAPVTALHLDAALSLLRQADVELPAGTDLRSPQGLQALLDALCNLSSRDALTGLANRRQFDLALAAEMDRVARHGEQVLLLMLDIDHFKRVNDSYGHPAGDAVIRAVAKALTDSVRPMDTPARVGGEEFAVILPGCAPSSALPVAERIRQRIESLAIEAAPGLVLRVTVSVGGAFAAPWVRSTPAMWIERADQKLYSAKAAGRNCTHLELPVMSEVSAEEKSLLFGASQFQDLA
jgi:diguanylate cyclase